MISEKEFRESLDDNIYMQGFLKNLYLRPSCHQCVVRSGRCGSDLTLGDFWGIWNIMPGIDDNKGVSVVLVNTRKGDVLLKEISPSLYEVSYSDVIKYNPCIEQSVVETKWRKVFMQRYLKDEDVYIVSSVIKQIRPNMLVSAISLFKKLLIRK